MRCARPFYPRELPLILGAAPEYCRLFFRFEETCDVMISVAQMISRIGLCSLAAACCLLGSGCSSVKRYALNRASDALSHTGIAFSSDDDPELIKAASPFSLKLMESVLEENPATRAPGRFGQQFHAIQLRVCAGGGR